MIIHPKKNKNKKKKKKLRDWQFVSGGERRVGMFQCYQYYLNYFQNCGGAKFFFPKGAELSWIKFSSIQIS